MNRRDVLAALPAAALQPIVGNASSCTVRPSPLRALYAEWQEVKRKYDHELFEFDCPVARALLDHMIACEQAAADFKPVTLEDFAFKVIFADDDGDLRNTVHQSGLVLEAYRIAGIPLSPGVAETAGVWSALRREGDDGETLPLI